MDNCNLVWFKKDLRTFDHQPLMNACDTGKAIALYVLEDDWVSSKEFSQHQAQFLRDSLIELSDSLATLNIPLIIKRGDMIACLNDLRRELKIKSLFSHYETGVAWTYERDKKVKQWCNENNINWREFHQFAVVRNLKSRDEWNKKRKLLIERDTFPRPTRQYNSLNVSKIKSLTVKSVFDDLLSRDLLDIQKGGRNEGINMLNSFLNDRGLNYAKNMSSPMTAYDNCSRISSHITWGTLSLSEIHNLLSKTRDKIVDSNTNLKSNWLKSLQAFESRLWWHCHFIQKLESEPSIEFKNVNAGFDGMREDSFNHAYFEAWKKGETGFPMIDACMRALIQHGWINFRMRAMLISFAAYQLWLHWEKPANYLAKLFTDFEPGIHYSQAQMQSGVTGINAIRIYSPIKQAKDQDPTGEFIKKYCPELNGLTTQNIHEPYTMSPIEQITSGVTIGKDYPKPIVEHAPSYLSARNTVYKWKSSEKTQHLAKVVYEKHGSRKNSFFPSQKRDEFIKSS